MEVQADFSPFLSLVLLILIPLFITSRSWRQGPSKCCPSTNSRDVSPVRRVHLQEHHLLRRLLPDHEGEHQAGAQVQVVPDERSRRVSGQGCQMSTKG